MSQLLPNQRLFYLHIPRTGGTWINEAFRVLNVHVSMRPIFKANEGRLPLKHSLLYHYSKKYLDRWDTSFSFVRHPVQYYESVWSYLKTVGEGNRAGIRNRFIWHPFTCAFKHWNDDFNIWVENMLSFYPGWVSHLFEMYIGPEGGEFCNYIGRTENIVSDFCEIMEDFNLSSDEIINLEKQNVSKFKANWDESLKLAVNKSEHLIINRFYKNDYVNKGVFRYGKKKETCIQN